MKPSHLFAILALLGAVPACIRADLVGRFDGRIEQARVLCGGAYLVGAGRPLPLAEAEALRVEMTHIAFEAQSQ